MVQDSGADDVLERSLKLAGPFDRKLVYFKVIEPVSGFQLSGERYAFRADVNAYDLRVRPTNGIVRGLDGAAAGYEDAAIAAVCLVRPKKMGLRAAARVVPSPAVSCQIAV
jgi:hypothetical protein